MKQKSIIFLSFLIVFNIFFNNVILSFASDVQPTFNNNSIENISYQTTDDNDFSNASNVFAELSSIYKVVIPKTVVLSGESKDTTYFVKAEGDIAGYETLNIVPDDKFNLYTKNKDLQIANITQDKTAWKYNDFVIDANGLIDAKGITAGKWQGAFNFNIFLSSEEEKVAGDIVLPYDLKDDYKLVISNLKKNSQPGLYNKDGELIKSYDYLALHDNISTDIVYGTENVPENKNSLNNIIENIYPETTYIILPKTIETIKTGGLDIKNINYIDIPLSVKNIENNAIGKIPFIEIPASVKNIGIQSEEKIYNNNGKLIQNIEIDLENNDTANIILEKGYTYQIKALYNFINDVTNQSTIVSDNENIVKYRPIYYLDALNVGNCTLRGTYYSANNQKNASIKITVVDTHTHERSSAFVKNKIEPTCSESGSFDEVVYCRICNKELSRIKKEIEPLGHNYDSSKITKEVTCTEAGVKTYTCSRCKNIKTETIAKLGHNYVNYFCTRCGKEIENNGEYAWYWYGGIYDYKDKNGKTSSYTGAVVIPEYVQSNGKLYKVTSIKRFELTQGCSKVTLPSTIKKIGNSAFVGNSADIIIIPTSVTSIGKYAFRMRGKPKIYYAGTKAQWKSILTSTTELFNYQYGGGTVYCSDGNITYQ